jgi:protein-tyrosine phosphatase
MTCPDGEGERRVSFTGVTNFRDLGGYPTALGGRTRWRRVFRADSLHNLMSDELAAFDALDVRVIYDLRRDDERQREPGPRPCTPVELPSLRVFDTDPSILRARIDGERWLFGDYCGMLQEGGPVFGWLFSRVAESHEGSVVVHCTGGKDRTGMVAALLLSCLGVDRHTVLDDYELSSCHRGAEHVPRVVDLFVANGIARPAAEAMLGTPRWAMAEALDLLDTAYGGVVAYLHDRGGMTPTSLEALRARLIA